MRGATCAVRCACAQCDSRSQGLRTSSGPGFHMRGSRPNAYDGWVGEGRKQALTAARSACRNTAEGFYRFGHPEFAHFVNIARGSLGELLETVADARLANYLTSDECDALEGRIQHAIAAASSLYTHLITTPTPPRASKAPKVPKRSK